MNNVQMIKRYAKVRSYIGLIGFGLMGLALLYMLFDGINNFRLEKDFIKICFPLVALPTIYYIVLSPAISIISYKRDFIASDNTYLYLPNGKNIPLYNISQIFLINRTGRRSIVKIEQSDGRYCEFDTSYSIPISMDNGKSIRDKINAACK